jgi:hypothetical protein
MYSTILNSALVTKFVLLNLSVECVYFSVELRPTPANWLAEELIWSTDVIITKAER